MGGAGTGVGSGGGGGGNVGSPGYSSAGLLMPTVFTFSSGYGNVSQSGSPAAASPVIMPQPAPVALKAAVNFCPFCGNKLQPGHKFCGNCGEKIPEIKQPPSHAVNSNHSSPLASVSLEPLLPLAMPAHSASLQSPMFSHNMSGLGLGGLASSTPHGGLDFMGDLGGAGLGNSMTTDLSAGLGGLLLGGLDSLGGGQWDNFGDSLLSRSLSDGNRNENGSMQRSNGQMQQNANVNSVSQSFGDDGDVDLNSLMGDFRAGGWDS